MTPDFKSILVANRGEIAVRILRTANTQGYRTIAVYSEADARAPHVKMADDAVLIGAAPATESYLDAGRIIAAAQQCNADAIHPGYGFLSENADFATACEAAGITFIGPGSAAIALMGNKAAAKRRMIAAGVPCVPGYEGEDQSDAAFIRAAQVIGYPIMVKAAAGGGGRGMRFVKHADDLPDALDLARAESHSAFGSDELILEKAIVRSRHVEIQVFADNHGNVIHLGERDCSVQRRHQKIIEEAPCPIMTDELRVRMCGAAIEAAKSIDYCGAGTVEFLLDEGGEFFFLEMNTRLQVEHPVTESVTGLDLVALQINVAQGEELPVAQDDVLMRGHAIEVRLYAEDSLNGFMPSTGRIVHWQAPLGDGIRIDSGIESGMEVSPWYDPLLAKIISHADTRQQALTQLIDALGETVLFGPTTNRDFLIRVLNSETFANGQATTAFIGAALDAEQPLRGDSNTSMAAIASVFAYRSGAAAAIAASVRVAPELCNWHSAGLLATRVVMSSGEETHTVRVSPVAPNTYRVNELTVAVLDTEDMNFTLKVGPDVFSVYSVTQGIDRIHIATKEQTARFTTVRSSKDAGETVASGHVVAPMHGQLLELCVTQGDRIEKGARLAVLEAMKMQHEIRARVGGVVRTLHYQAGAQIAAGELILEIEEST